MIELRTKFDMYLAKPVVKDEMVQKEDVNRGFVKRVVPTVKYYRACTRANIDENSEMPNRVTLYDCAVEVKKSWLDSLIDCKYNAPEEQYSDFQEQSLEVVKFPAGSRITDVYGKDFEDFLTAEEMILNGYFLIETDRRDFSNRLQECRNKNTGHVPTPLVPYNMVKGKVFEYQIPYFDYIGDWFRIIEK